MPKTLVIVESPAKAQTISRFLGRDYEVLASYGHVRDLPENSDQIPEKFKKEKWARLGVNIANDYEPLYVVPADKKRRVDELKKAAAGAERILLATDEDREGESISWHVLQVLKPKKSVEVKRIVFHEITPEAIDAAVKKPRNLDEDLVKAQETRRILDRLYGYTLSPLLWKKVAPKLSAGRVQSVAVRLIVIRERERRDFVIAEYSGLTANLKAKNEGFGARLVRIASSRVADGANFDSDGQLKDGKFHWLKKPEAATLQDALGQAKPWTVVDLEKKPGQENPPAPFMTSTLQQDANRKFGYPARRTMQIAQELYEGIDFGKGERVGLITYMRTDSLSLADRAVAEARQVIEDLYGKEHVPAKPKVYKSKAKNAQEAHEAIRPTDLTRRPQDLKNSLSPDQFKIYELIWKRTIACQMKPAEVERTRVEVEVSEGGSAFGFSASGKAIVFPGFLRAYVEGSDDPDADLEDRETILPAMKIGDVLDLVKVEATEHSTKPPARYTEATLVRTLEAEGVGRPSTYASIIGTIQDRGYVFKRRNELIPTFTAFAVTELLENNFNDLVNIGFTATMEEQLDDIADGKRDSVAHLREFYEGDLGIEKQVEKKTPDIAFPALKLGEDIVIRIGRNGPYLQRGEGGPGNTANISPDLPPADLTYQEALAIFEQSGRGPESIGTDPESGRSVFHKKGRFGDYLEVEPLEGEEKPKRVTVPPGVNAGDLSQDDLDLLLAFPKTLGQNAEGHDVVLAVGRYGAYLSAGEKKANVGDWREAGNLTLEGAITAIETGRAARTSKGSTEPIAVLGTADGIEGEIKVLEGRFGPYVSNGKIHATIPKSKAPASVTLAEAAEMIKAKAAAGPSKKKFVRRKK
jgi:DNA topoisomerase-1